MAKHHFGIMEQPPKTGARYDTFEPEKYACIAVRDDDMDRVLNDIRIPCCWHRMDRLHEGLTETGISLIPPESCERMAEQLPEERVFSALSALLRTAAEKGKFVIHFGI